MSEIYKIKMELTKNEYDRLCELLNIDINFLQPTRTEPNTFSEDIMRKMMVEIKTRDYDGDNRTLNEAMQEHLERRREVVSDITSAVDKAIEEHGYFVDNVLPTKDGFIIRITESEE